MSSLPESSMALALLAEPLDKPLGLPKEGGLERKPNTSSGRTQYILRIKILPCFPEMGKKTELRFLLPFSLKTTHWPWALVSLYSLLETPDEF